MKSLLCMFALVLVGASANILNYAASSTPAPSGCQAGCSDDCSMLTICSGEVPVQISCPIQTDWKKPFCNAEEYICDTKPDFCQAKGEGRCDLRDGFYPNLLDCGRYFYCDGVKKQKINYNCPDNSHFNPVSQKCEVDAKCLAFDAATGVCKGKTGKLVAHPLKKDLYVLCNNVPLLFQCVDDSHYSFNEESSGCIFVCDAPGMFQDSEKVAMGDRTYYFECVKNGTTFKRYHKQCPSGSIFEGNKCKLTKTLLEH